MVHKKIQHMDNTAESRYCVDIAAVTGRNSSMNTIYQSESIQLAE